MPTGRDIVTFIVVAVALLAVLLIDLYLLPEHVLVASLYAVPVLIAAHRWSPRVVGVIAALAIAFDLLAVLLKQAPLSVWPYGTLALLVITYLAVQLSVQRQETTRRVQEADEARQRLQEFLAMVSHDLRGPLSTLLGYAQLLTRNMAGRAPETEYKALLAIEGAANQMRRLVDDLLDAAHIGTGRFVARPVPMDLIAVARQVVEQQRATAPKHQLILDAPERLEGCWDPERMIQLLTNLVSNAIKYSPRGGEVRVAVREAAGEVLLSVSDPGIGIDRADIPLLFQPFSRLYRQQAIKGTGLGLYITKAIVEAHGGRIWVESEPGKGSVFYVALPRHPH